MKIVFVRNCITIFLFILVQINAKDNKQQQDNPKPIVPYILQTYYTTLGSSTFFFTAREPKDFAIGYYFENYATNEELFKGLAPEKIVLNNNADQINPLYGKKLTILFDSLRSLPLIVDTENPSILYALENVSGDKNQQVLSTSTINDAQGAITDGIINACTLVTESLGKMYEYDLLAVKKNKGEFGQSDSGLALVKKDYLEIENKIKQPDDTEKVEKHQKFFFDTLDAKCGTAHGNKAYPIEDILSLASINDGLEKIDENKISFYWDQQLQRYYIGLGIHTKQDATLQQGACALLVGRVVNNCLQIEPIISRSVLEHYEDSIVGTTGPNKFLSIRKIKVMHTTTGLSYLIFATEDQTIFALPLIDRRISSDMLRANDIQQGTVAAKNQIPQIHFHATNRFSHRSFDTEVSEKNTEWYKKDDTAVLVGGPTLMGTIKDILINQDAVYVLVESDEETLVLHSQAILDGHGSIATWTSWKPVIHGRKPFVGFQFGNEKSLYFLLHKDAVMGILPAKTNWYINTKNKAQTSLQELTQIIEQELPIMQGGIQYMQSIYAGMPGSGVYSNATFLLFVGCNKIIIAQRGIQTSEQIAVNKTFYQDHFAKFTNGSLSDYSGSDNPTIIGIEGGDLQDIAPLTCATIVTTEDQQELLCVGGYKGVAVLCREDGSGWTFHEGLGTYFSSLDNKFRFRKLGNFNNVRKIMSSNGNVYVLSGTKVERFELSSLLNPQQILLASHKHGIYDALIADSFALLALPEGLVRNCNATNIATARSEDEISWQSVVVPESNDPVQKIISITIHGDEAGVIYQGQLYFLCGSKFNKISSIHRAYVELNRVGVHDTTLQFVPDIFIKDKKLPLMSFNMLPNTLFVDGAFYMSSVIRSTMQKPYTLIFNPFYNKSMHLNYKPIDLSLDKAQIIRDIVRDPASGSLIICADDGLRIHE